MHLQITLDKYPGALEAERLASALLILGGSDAIVAKAIAGLVAEPLLPLSVGEVVDRVYDETVVNLAPGVTLEEAAALLGGALPPSDAGTASSPATPSGSVVAPPPASSAPTAGAEAVRLDSAGMPYDVRIHSGAMSQKKDGTWTAKRGVSELLISQIEAEHKAAGYGVAASATTTITPPPAAGTTVVTPPPAAAAVTPPPGPAIAPDPEAFKALVSVMGAAMSGGQLTKPQIDAALATLGLKAVPELQGRPDLIETFKLHLGI